MFSKFIKAFVLGLSGALLAGWTTAASAQAVMPLHGLKVGDCVQFQFAGGWEAALIAGPESAGGYPANWGPMGTTVIANSRDTRPCPPGVVALGADPETKAALAKLPKGDGLGARYGTRDPATCPNRKVSINAETAKKLLACDSEGVLTRDTLFLVSDVVVQVGSPREFNYRQDSIATAIDVKQPVYDIRGSYTQYQCGLLSAGPNDYAKTHNCYKYPAVPGGVGRCYTDTFGDKHCQMTGGGGQQLKNQLPPPAN